MRPCPRCAGQQLVSDLVPRSVPARQCEGCGQFHLEPLTFARVRAETRGRVGQKAMHFGFNSLPWKNCLLCGNQRVMPAQDGLAECSACKEVYLPLAEARGAARETPGAIEARLFEEIARSPDDDAPRHVLADLFLERGDPRGEFISVQLEEEQLGPSLDRAQRINRLLDQHRLDWVPRGVDAASCEFRRGLLWRAGWPESTSPTHEGWATVEELVLPTRLSEPGAREWSPLGGPTRHALRRIGRCGPFVRKWLLVDPPPRLTSLGLFVEEQRVGPQLASSLASELRVFTQLTELDVEWNAYARVPESVLHELIEAFGPRLTTLWLPASISPSALEPTVRRVAPRLSLRLSSSTEHFPGRAWIQVEDGRRRLETRGETSEYLLQRLRPLL